MIRLGLGDWEKERDLVEYRIDFGLPGWQRTWGIDSKTSW